MASRYQWRIEGGFFDDVDPQVAGEHLDELIDKRNEHVTADELVADGKKSDSPIHKCFTWDDTVAAHKWRKKEAKMLTSQLMSKTPGHRATRSFCWVHHPKHGGKKVLMSRRSAGARAEFKGQLQQQGLMNLKRSLGYMEQAYGGTPGLNAVFRDVKALRKKVEKQLKTETAKVEAAGV
jgi:hypothetical protein